MSLRRLANIRRLQTALDELFENRNSQTTVNQTIDDQQTYTFKKVLSHDGKKLLRDKIYLGNEMNCMCPILNIPFQEFELVTELPCKHIFDKKSILYWLENEKAECPICRLSLPSIEKRVLNSDSATESDNSDSESEATSINQQQDLEEEEEDEINLDIENLDNKPVLVINMAISLQSSNDNYLLQEAIHDTSLELDIINLN